MNLTKEQILNYLLAIADELTDAHHLTDTDSTVEANSAVLHHQAQVLANINNPKVLDEHSRSHARLDADVGNIKKDIKALHNMHNGSHPPTR